MTRGSHPGRPRCPKPRRATGEPDPSRSEVPIRCDVLCCHSFPLRPFCSATTSAVLATPPTREPLGLPQVIEFAAGEACPFAVTVDVLADSGKVTTFYDRRRRSPQGDHQRTPQLFG